MCAQCALDLPHACHINHFILPIPNHSSSCTVLPCVPVLYMTSPYVSVHYLRCSQSYLVKRVATSSPSPALVHQRSITGSLCCLGICLLLLNLNFYELPLITVIV